MPTFVKYILVFFISMVPIIELRGAVPIGVTYFGLNEYITLAVCVIGNMIPVPFIYLFGRKILEWGSKLKHGSGLFKWVLQKGEKAGKKLTANSKKSGAFIALMLFVGIPLPGTVRRRAPRLLWQAFSWPESSCSSSVFLPKRALLLFQI